MRGLAWNKVNSASGLEWISVDLRGSGAYDHIKELVAQEFIERRRQSEGRSYWITLTEKFHRTFSVLPDLGATDLTEAA